MPLDFYYKAVVFRIEGGVFDIHIPDISGERFFYIGDAVAYIVRVALQEQLHFAVGRIAYVSRKAVTGGNAVGGVSEPDTLNIAAEDNKFRNLH
jgi:hypothetical protein